MSVPYPLTCSGLDGRVGSPSGTRQRGRSPFNRLTARPSPASSPAPTRSPRRSGRGRPSPNVRPDVRVGLRHEQDGHAHDCGQQHHEPDAGDVPPPNQRDAVEGKYLVHEGILVLSSSPGSGTALTTYNSFQDMQRLYSQIGDLHDAGTAKPGLPSNVTRPECGWKTSSKVVQDPVAVSNLLHLLGRWVVSFGAT